MIRSIGLALVTVAMIAGCSASGEAANPLLGKWVAEPNGFVDRNGFAWCAVVPEIDFAPTTQVMHTAPTKYRPGSTGSTSVSYLVAGNKVYVSATRGFAGAPMYTIINANEM